MKKKLFGSAVGKIFLGIVCLILAIFFWFAVKYFQIGGLPMISPIFG